MRPWLTFRNAKNVSQLSHMRNLSARTWNVALLTKLFRGEVSRSDFESETNTVGGRVSHIKLGIKYEHSDYKFCRNPKLLGLSCRTPHAWRKFGRLEAWNKFGFILRFPKKCAIFYAGMQEKSKPNGWI